MKDKRQYWCPFCGRYVSLWRTEDGRLFCPRCGRRILQVTPEGQIQAIEGKPPLGREGGTKSCPPDYSEESTK